MQNRIATKNIFIYMETKSKKKYKNCELKKMTETIAMIEL